jgi:hypothetical protein
MITKSPIIINADALEKAESMNLPLPDEELEFVDLGFRLSDIMYYKSIPQDDIIELTFRNGKQETIQYSQSTLVRLQTIFEKA